MEGSPGVRAGVHAGVDGERLWRRLMAMAEIGAIPGDGVNRQALSEEDLAARAVLIAWARERGYAVEVDEIANLFIRRPGLDPDLGPVMTGSHMDSQPRGGRFDGIYGVLAGLEALEAMDDIGARTRRPIEVVAWTNEEGSRFDPGCMGSMVFAGLARIEGFAGMKDTAGTRFADALSRVRAAEAELPRRASGPAPAACVEPHIEQGPVLEAAGAQIGAVTGIQGSTRFVVETEGETAHAGTMPIAARRDALQAALRVIARLNEVMSDPDDVLRFTVGRMEVEPNAPNTVPGRVSFSIDLRHPDRAELDRRCALIEPAAREVAGPCSVGVVQSFGIPPRRFDPTVVDLIAETALALDMECRRLPSGAFHDAASLAALCPTGMVFIPCRNGVSHHESEYASPEDCHAGAQVLTAVLSALANR